MMNSDLLQTAEATPPMMTQGLITVCPPFTVVPASAHWSREETLLCDACTHTYRLFIRVAKDVNRVHMYMYMNILEGHKATPGLSQTNEQ